MVKKNKKISFQGSYGAYSDLSCRTVAPEMETLPCHSFESAFNAVIEGKAELAMIPVDNSLAGRVADVHHLLPNAGLHIIGEHFQPIKHALLGIKGAKIEDIKDVHSHVHAIPQCRNIIKKLGLTPHIHADTAGAAYEVAQKKDKTRAAIASSLAAKIYDLDILINDIQDADHNTTRFLILSKEKIIPEYKENTLYITSFVFKVRNISASLYKALGGFATNNINMTKLESYVDENFKAAQFYCEVEGHIDEKKLQMAFEELGFFAKELTILGTYKASPFRNK